MRRVKIALVGAGNIARAHLDAYKSVPVRKCLEALKLAKYDGFLTIEFEGPGNCIDNVARSLANLKGILSEINL